MVVITLRRIATIGAATALGVLVFTIPGLAAWNPGTRAAFWVLVATAAAAVWYGWLTFRLLRAQHTPVLVIAYEENRTIVRNFGGGAALNALLTTAKGQKISRASDIAPGGTCNVSVALDWTITEAKYLFYQDIYSRWYGTKSLGQSLSQAAYMPVANVFLGRVFNPPTDARRAALVRSVVEDWVQLNRSWDPRYWIRLATFATKKWRAEKRIMKLVWAAIAAGELPPVFTSAELSTAAELERVVADRFLPNHAVGNAAGEREFFVQESSGRYRLKRRGE